MIRKIIGIFVVTLLIATALPLVSGDNTVFLNTIIVPDDYPTIQKAINNSNDGDTIFVRAGTYFENLIVDKSIIMTGENIEATIIDGGGSGTVITVTSNGVSIFGFTIRNSGSNAGNNDSAIILYSSYNNISNNIIGQNFFGLLVERSSYNIILNNKFIEDGIGFTAGTNLHKKSYYNHVIKGNTVNDKPLYYYKQKNDFIVPQDAGQIILFNCDNVMIENQHIEYGDVAILLAYCDSCTIQKSLFSNNLSIGVVMINSHYNIIRENNISNNEVVQYSIGIYTDYCNNNIYKDNYIANNNWGLSLMNSHYCTIENNNFIDNEGYGVALFTSTYIKILNNSVIGDTSRGFSLDTVGMTEITNNTISLNYGNKIAGWGCMGIWVLPYGWGIRIKENHISKCQTGILIETSYNNHVENNYITDCRIAGSSQLSNRDIIEAFLPKEKLIEPLAAIPSKGCGIYIFNSGTNWIKYNSVKENQIGIVLIRSTRNDIRLNNIEDSLTGFELISFLSTGYYPLNFWGSSITGPLFKSNKFLVLIPWSPIRISQAP